MKKIAILAVAVLPLAGCAPLKEAADWFASPQAAIALANAKGWAQVASCSISNLATVATKIEVAVKANKAALDTTGNVYTVSAIVCQSLGGTVTSMQAVN